MRLKQQLLQLLREKYSKPRWHDIARQEQRLPVGDWRIWLILAGRGFGKTRTGAESIMELIKCGYKRIALIGNTDFDVMNVMISGQSGIASISDISVKVTKDKLIFANGAQCLIVSAHSYLKLRGPEFDCVWMDEFAKFDDPQAVLEQAQLALRLSTAPRMIITTTPLPLPIIRKLIADPHVRVTRGKTSDNHANLSATFVDTVYKTFADTRFGAQELDGEIVEQVTQGICANILYIDNPTVERCVVAIDPAATQTGDETGIIVCGKKDDKYYVLQDGSGRYSPYQWASKAIELYHKYQAEYIVAEVNQGGDMIESLLRNIDPNVRYRSVRAHTSKVHRAMRICTLYDQQKILHACHSVHLERQLADSNWTHSPDRVDALVWAVEHLAEDRQVFAFTM